MNRPGSNSAKIHCHRLHYLLNVLRVQVLIRFSKNSFAVKSNQAFAAFLYL